MSAENTDITYDQAEKMQAIMRSELQRDRPENIWIHKGICSCHASLIDPDASEKERFLSFYFGMCKQCVFKLLETMHTTVDQEFDELIQYTTIEFD